MWWILLLGICLRLILIGQSLWLDEAIEALALMGKQGNLLTYALGDYQPPLYHLIGYLTTHLFGYSEFALRLPSLLAGVLTIYFVYKLGELLQGSSVGKLAAMLAATNPLLIYYSQEGRTYALTTFFVTASFYYLLKHLETERFKEHLLYIVCLLGVLWTSYLAWLVVLVQVGYLLKKKRYDLVCWQVAAGLTLLAWLPSLIQSLAIGQSTRTHSPEWGRVVGGISWKSVPLTWVKFVIGRISLTPQWVYAGVVTGIGFLHVLVLRRVSLKNQGLLLSWVLIPIALGVLIASYLPIYQYFRVLFVLPAYLILLAVGLAKSQTKRLTFLVIGLQLLALCYFWSQPQFHREDWHSLTRDLNSDSKASVAIVSRAQSAPLTYYGLHSTPLEPSHEELSGERIYYIRYVEDLFDTQKRGQANFQSSGYTVVGGKSYPGIQVDIYEHRN